MDGLLAAADALAMLVHGNYGPSGEEVLVFAPPDAPLITADGHTLLLAKKQQNANASADAASPFERVILDMAEGVYREAGDGATLFVLLVHGVLQHVARDGHGGRLDTCHRVRMARAFGTLRHEWDAKTLLLPETQTCVMMEESAELEVATSGVVTLSPTLHECAIQVLTTALAGVLSQHVVHQLVGLVMQWVFSTMRQQPEQPPSDPLSFLHRHLQLYQQQAPRAIIHANGGSFTASYIAEDDEFLLQKSLLPSQLPSLLGGVSPLRFVCVTGQLDLTLGSNEIVYERLDHADAIQAVDVLRMRAVEFLTKLRESHDVRLLISTEKIEEYVAAACCQLQLACIQYAECEDVMALCLRAGVRAITSVVEEVEEVIHIGVCSRGASVVRHAQAAALRLRGLRTAVCPETVIIPQLVVYASSKAVFKPYYNAVLKCLRVLRCLFTGDTSDTRPRIRVCRGAGATELTIAKALQRAEQQQTRVGTADSYIQQAMLALATALMESVVQLRSNLIQGCGANETSRANRQSCRVLLDEMNRNNVKPRGYVLDMEHAITTKLGSVRIPTLVEADPTEYHVIHPWRRIDTIIHAVLQTTERLLRVDGVIRITRNPERQRTGLHEASDGDGDR